MTKKIVIGFKNPVDEARIDHLEIWVSTDSAVTFNQLGADIPFVTGVGVYSVDDTSGYVVDDARLDYQVRTYNVGGLFNYVAGTITVDGTTVDLYEPSWISEFTIQPQDANGFTVFTPDATSQIVYVDATLGNDGTALIYDSTDTTIFADPFTEHAGLKPYQTVSAAHADMRDNQADWILLKKDETFVTAGHVFQIKKGLSNTARALYSAYGAGTARPLIKVSNGANAIRMGDDDSFFDVAGIEFYAYQRDPDSPDYIDLASVGSASGVSIYDTSGQDSSNFMLEDNKFSFFQNNLSFTDDNSGTRTDIVIRRNIIANAFSGGGHSQGFWCQHSSVLVEENVFSHKGWSSVQTPTIFNHNLYHSGMTNSIYRNNISIDPSSIHFKMTANPTIGVSEPNTIESSNISVYSNLMVDGELVFWPTGNDSNSNGYRYSNMLVNDNVSINVGKSQNTGRTLGWGMQVTDLDGGEINGNYFLHTDNALVTQTSSIWVPDIYTINQPDVVNYMNNVEVTGNKSYKAGGDVGVSESATILNTTAFSNSTDLADIEYVDPARKIETYMTSLGQTATVAEFTAKCLLQGKSSWNTSYTTALTNTYLKAGYAYVSDVVVITDLSATGSYTIGTTFASVTYDVISESTITYVWKVGGVVDATNTTQSFDATGLTGNFTLQCIATANGTDSTSTLMSVTETAAVAPFLTFDSTLLKRVDLDVSLSLQQTAGNSLSFEFKASTAATKYVLAENGQTNKLTISAAGVLALRFWAGSILYYTPPMNIFDGVWRTFKFIRRADTGVELELAGVVQQEDTSTINGNGFGAKRIGTDGSLNVDSEFSIRNLESVGSNSYTMALDSGSVSGETENSDSGVAVVATFPNVVAGDWT